MPWVIQMAGFALLILGIAVAMWVSLWLLGIVFVGALLFVGYVRIREFLLEKGILNPTPGVPPQHTSDDLGQITIVDADFTRVEQSEKKPE